MGDSIEFYQLDVCPLLAIEDLSKGFTLHAADRRVRGCEHISLSVLPGEFVALPAARARANPRFSSASIVRICRKAATSCTIPRPLVRSTLPRSMNVV